MRRSGAVLYRDCCLYDIINCVEWYLSYADGIFPMGRGVI